MNLKLLDEAIEGLPTSFDPYATGVRDDIEAEMPEEGENVGEEDEEGLEDEEDFGDKEGLGGGEDDEDILGDIDLGGEDLEPKINTKDEVQQSWKPFVVPGKKDVAFERSDGFKLRARMLDSVPNKWVAQLWVGDKILDHGTLFVPKDVDPSDYLKEMANYMLDAESNRYQQEDIPEEEPSLGLPPEELEGPGEGEDIGLSDEDIELG